MRTGSRIRTGLFAALAMTSAACSAGNTARNFDELKQALTSGKHVSVIFDHHRCGAPMDNPVKWSGTQIGDFMVIRNNVVLADKVVPKDKIVFSVTHPTLHQDKHDPDIQYVVTEFLRYAVDTDGTVKMTYYMWKPGDSQGTAVSSMACSMDDGATFTW